VVCICVVCVVCENLREKLCETLGIFLRAGLDRGPKGVKKGSRLNTNGARVAPRGGPESSTFALGAC